MTTTLTDLQRVLLTAAAGRADGHVLPLPESVAAATARIRKTIPSLLKRKLIAEIDAVDAPSTWREEDELVGGERHDLLAVGAVATVVLVAEGVRPPQPASRRQCEGGVAFSLTKVSPRYQ